MCARSRRRRATRTRTAPALRRHLSRRLRDGWDGVGDVGLVDLGSPLLTLLSAESGGAWWSVAARDRNQQRKQLLDLAAEHAKLLSAVLRGLPGIR